MMDVQEKKGDGGFMLIWKLPLQYFSYKSIVGLNICGVGNVSNVGN